MHVTQSLRSLAETIALRVKPVISRFFVGVNRQANQSGWAHRHQPYPDYCVVKSPVHALHGKKHPLIP